MEDTDDFRREDVNERFLLQGGIMKIASKIEELKKQLAENLAEYDNDKYATVMETKINEDLKRQIKRLKHKYERLLKKQEELKLDKELLDEFDNSKVRFNEEQEENVRLNQKLYWYDKELSKVNDEKNEENQKDDAIVPGMSERKLKRHGDYNEVMPINYYSKSKYSKLPLIGIKGAELHLLPPRYENSLICKPEGQGQPESLILQPACNRSSHMFADNSLPPISNNVSIEGNSGDIIHKSQVNADDALSLQRKINSEPTEDHNEQFPTTVGTSTKSVAKHVPHPPSQRPNSARRYVRKHNNK
ncbi:hypothetical protein ACF0H5_000638 [Mactra antiquata]